MKPTTYGAPSANTLNIKLAVSSSDLAFLEIDLLKKSSAACYHLDTSLYEVEFACDRKLRSDEALWICEGIGTKVRVNLRETPEGNFIADKQMTPLGDIFFILSSNSRRNLSVTIEVKLLKKHPFKLPIRIVNPKNALDGSIGNIKTNGSTVEISTTRAADADNILTFVGDRDYADPSRMIFPEWSPASRKLPPPYNSNFPEPVPVPAISYIEHLKEGAAARFDGLTPGIWEMDWKVLTVNKSAEADLAFVWDFRGRSQIASSKKAVETEGSYRVLSGTEQLWLQDQEFHAGVLEPTSSGTTKLQIIRLRRVSNVMANFEEWFRSLKEFLEGCTLAIEGANPRPTFNLARNFLPNEIIDEQINLFSLEDLVKSHYIDFFRDALPSLAEKLVSVVGAEPTAGTADDGIASLAWTVRKLIEFSSFVGVGAPIAADSFKVLVNPKDAPLLHLGRDAIADLDPADPQRDLVHLLQFIDMNFLQKCWFRAIGLKTD